MTEVQGSALVLRRPQFRLIGDELFFLICHRPRVRLSPVESAVWTALQNSPSVEELRANFPGEADRALHRLSDLGLCDITQMAYPKSRRRVLVFEPHSDDAILSVGGAMWQRRHECEFIIVTIGSQTNYTTYYYLNTDFFDVEQISCLRNAEGAVAAQLLGGQHRALAEPDALLRYQSGDWSLDWYRRHKLSVLTFLKTHYPVKAELEKWAGAMHAVLRADQADEVWCPLGGLHTDHQLARDGLLTLMVEDRTLFTGRHVRFYQDVPYAAQLPAFVPTVVGALTQAGAVLLPEIVSIESVFRNKLKLISVYESQFSLQAIQQDIEINARLAGGGSILAERFWSVTKPPEALNRLSLRVNEPTSRRAIELLGPWALRHRDAKRIRLVSLIPEARWSEDLPDLLDIFPEAHFDLHLNADDQPEVVAACSPRIRVRLIKSGVSAWAMLALEGFLRSAPTLFISGHRRRRHARFLSTIWPMSDGMIMPTLDQLISALRQIV